MTFYVIDSMRSLGYVLACNGDTGVTRDRMLGTLSTWRFEQEQRLALKARGAVVFESTLVEAAAIRFNRVDGFICDSWALSI